MRRLRDLLKRFRRDESGSFLVIFALLAIVLIATSGAVVDFTYTQTARSRAQTALDAAALALQPKVNDVAQGKITKSAAEADIKTKAEAILDERLADSSISATVSSATINTTAGTLDLAARITVPTAFVQLVGVHSISAQLTSQVTRGSKDIEVSVALDTTGSMSGSKILDLQDATDWLIDNVVQDVQTPTYSKMAIVPWSAAVNVGTYANAVRGTPTPGATISAASWISGTSKTISGISNANPAVVTTSSSGLTAGDYVYINGVGGMTNVNNKIFKVGTVNVSNPKKFNLLNTNGTNVDSRFWSSFSSSGWGVNPTIGKCQNSSCQVLVTTSTAHGQATNDTVYITGATGMTGLNGTHATAVGSVPSSTTYYLSDTAATSSNVGFNSYTANSGTSYCTTYGCTYYYFTRTWGGQLLYKANSCATERTTHASDDSPPTTTLLGFNYTNNGTDCLGQVIQPLTTDKTALHNLADNLTAAGSTAGHLGLAWGWYMVSPTFVAGVPGWPAASVPAAYKRNNLVKAVILMTDGDFNIQYCNGVTDGTINCSSPNGDSRTQAQALCDEIKKTDYQTILYTVGFDLAGNTSALNFLQGCASEPADFFQADTGADLKEAFKEILDSLNDLRISK